MACILSLLTKTPHAIVRRCVNPCLLVTTRFILLLFLLHYGLLLCIIGLVSSIIYAYNQFDTPLSTCSAYRRIVVVPAKIATIFSISSIVLRGFFLLFFILSPPFTQRSPRLNRGLRLIPDYPAPRRHRVSLCTVGG